MIFCDGFNYAGNKTKNNAAFCDCWSFGLCNSTFHVMTLTAFFKYNAEENFDDHWAIAFTAAIIKFDQKCLLALRSPFCYSPFVLYFYTTELNQGSSPVLMQSDLFYPLNHQLGKLQAAKSAWPVCLCLFGLIFSCWVLLATMGVLLGPITSFWLVLYWVVNSN